MANCCCPDSSASFVSDEFCGNFTIDCAADPGTDIVVWDSTFTIDAGTISVFYDNGCDDTLSVTIYRGGSLGTEVDTLEIPLATSGPNGNTRSVTVQNFDTVVINCTGDGTGTCRGKYCISANYFL